MSFFHLTNLNYLLLFCALSIITRFDSGNLSHILKNFAFLIVRSSTGSLFSSKLNINSALLYVLLH